MLEQELQQYLLREYPQENTRCEWKEFKNLKNSFCGDEKDDVISYVSAIANMEGGHLVIGVKDKTLEIVGTDISKLTFNGQPANTQSATFKLTEQCTYLSSEGLSIEEFITDDTNKRSVQKDNEIRQYGEYHTKRLVLEVWNKFGFDN